MSEEEVARDGSCQKRIGQEMDGGEQGYRESGILDW